VIGYLEVKDLSRDDLTQENAAASQTHQKIDGV
jgi:hypothetical protein